MSEVKSSPSDCVQQLQAARDTFEIAYNDGQRMNSSDSNCFAVVLSDGEKKKILDVLANDHDGKERKLDELVHKFVMDGCVARMRSIEYSQTTKRNKEIAQAIADCKSPADLENVLRKYRAAAQAS